MQVGRERSVMGLFRKRTPPPVVMHGLALDACPSCGTAISDDPSFCWNCGTPLDFDDIEELDAGGVFDEDC